MPRWWAEVTRWRAKAHAVAGYCARAAWKAVGAARAAKAWWLLKMARWRWTVAELLLIGWGWAAERRLLGWLLLRRRSCGL